MIQTIMLSKDDLNHQYHHHYSNGNYLNDNKMKKGEKSVYNTNNENDTTISKLSNFDKLCDDIKNNPAYRKEIALERLIGFYRIGSEIGIGNFSQVKLGLHLLTRDKVAIKILNKTKLDEKTQRLLLREISSMQKLHHQNIIRLYEVIHTSTRLYICMEYAPDGELFTRINESGKIKEAESRNIFSQIISAVNHMHSNNIIHRDIKAENIFFSNFYPIIVKIGDFGFSIEANSTKQLNTYCGSPPYAAPELFRDDTYLGIYVDIWALGVLLYFMVTSIMPFKAETVSKLKRVILNGEYTIPSYVSDSCQLLIRGILKPVPTDRYSIKEIMESAWLDGEKFSTILEPYQLNPNKDKNELKPEELYSLKYLENLGITKEHLIYSNLKEHSFNSDLSQNSSNIFSPANPQSHYMNNLINYKNGIQFSEKNFTHNFKFSYELKQSINGTYRIVFHMIQKKMLNEFNSDQMKLKKEENYKNNHLDLDSKSLKLEASLSNGHRQSVSINNHNLDVDDDENDDEDLPGNSILVSAFKKQSLNNKTNPNENKSVFVRLNSNASTNKLENSKKNIFNGDISPKETLFQKNRNSLNSNNSNNKKRPSNINNSNSNQLTPQQSKQTSKFCIIL